MSTLHIRHTGTVYDYPENSSIGNTVYASRFLNVKVNSSSTAKWGLTNNTNAFQYCKMSIRYSDGNIYRLNRSSMMTYLSGNTPQRNGSAVKNSNTEALTESYTQVTRTVYGSKTYTTGVNYTVQINTTNHKELRTSKYEYNQEEPTARQQYRTVSYVNTHHGGVSQSVFTGGQTNQAQANSVVTAHWSTMRTNWAANHASQSNGSTNGATTWMTKTWRKEGRGASSGTSSRTFGTQTVKESVNQGSYSRTVTHREYGLTTYKQSNHSSTTFTTKVASLMSRFESWIITNAANGNFTTVFRTSSNITGTTYYTGTFTRTTATRISETLCN